MPKTKTTEEYKKEVYSLTNGEYEVLENYIGNKTKIKHKHVKCGNIYEVRPNDFLNGYRCPKCSVENLEGHGLSVIKKFLKDKNIEFIIEKKFESCKLTRFLRFDIFIPSEKLLIEFDGQQHFIVRGNTIFEKGMSDRVKRDWYKNIWCKNNDYKLLRIPYTISDFKIEEILNDILFNKSLDKLSIDSIYYNDNNKIYNRLKYYSQRNSLYFSLYSSEIESIFNKYD